MKIIYIFHITYRTMDTLIKRRFLQIFNSASSEKFGNSPHQKFCFNSSTLFNCNKQIGRSETDAFEQKQNNIKTCVHAKSRVHNSNTPSYLSDTLKTIPATTQSPTSTVPFKLSNELKTSSLSCIDKNSFWAKVTRTEEVQLRAAAWYQPGLSRYFCLEIISPNYNIETH